MFHLKNTLNKPTSSETARALSLLVICVLTLSGCSSADDELRVYPLSYQQMDPEAMEAIFEQRSGVRMRLAKPISGVSALDALARGEVDLTLVENSTPFESGVRAVLPTYKSVLHLLARDGFSLQQGQQSLKGASIYVANDSKAGKTFIELAAQRQHVAADDLHLVSEFVPGETDLIVYFGPITPSNHAWYYPGYRLLSLNDSLAASNRDHLEGIRHLVPQMRVTVIPSRTYDLPGNEGPIASLEVDTLLVTRKAVPEAVIYELTKTLIQQKPRFTAIAPALFSGLTENFDPMDLNFPLHRGARRFLNRDEPSFLERYAETINMLVYLAFLLLTSLVGISRWRAQRKKDRIDTFYTRVLAIRERADGEDSDFLLAELDALEKEAFESLIAEKLAADESFRIFTELLSRARAELKP